MNIQLLLILDRIFLGFLTSGPGHRAQESGKE